jgi:asparagine synthase (glutamine-hydrolysing)
MYKLAREAKKQVTVILTGEGGDELFAGYLFHKLMSVGETYRKIVPSPVRDWVVDPLLAISPPRMMNLAFQYPAYLGNRGKLKVQDYHRLLAPDRAEEAYRHLISLFDPRDTAELYDQRFKARLDESAPAPVPHDPGAAGQWEPYLNRLIRLQFGYWLPDNMLLRQDKTGMASAIEGRVPYLDHELVEFSMRIPPGLKLRGTTGKYILRRFAAKLLPDEVVNRKKMPFYVPIENYFEHPEFRDMVEDLLSPETVANRGLFRPEAVEEIRSGMHRKEFMIVKQVFSLMVLELWFRIFVDRSISVS